MQAKARELDLQLEMLCARTTPSFRTLSVELYGPVDADARRAGRAHPRHRRRRRAHRPARSGAWRPTPSPQRAEAELDHYRVEYPDLSVFVEVRDDCTEVMVANGVLLVPGVRQRVRATRRRAARPRGRHARAHVRERIGATAAPARGGPGRLRGDPGGTRAPRRAPRRRLRRSPAPPDRGPGRRRAPHARRCDLPRRCSTRSEPTGIAPTRRLRDDDASLPLGRSHQGRRLPARTLRPARAPRLAGGALDTLWLGKMPLTSVPIVRRWSQRARHPSARVSCRATSERSKPHGPAS